MREALRRLIERPIAHRGLHGCGRREGPIENSIGAARAAIEAGYGIECDIRSAADGEAMVFHDDRLERLTAAAGRLADRDSGHLAEIALGATGDRIPTLAAFLAAIGGRVPVVIEIKSEIASDLRLAERALAILSTYAGPVALESFDEAIVAHCLSRGAPCPVGLVGPAAHGGNDPALIARCDFLSWSTAHIGDASSRYAGKPLTTWTVRTAAQRAAAEAHAAQIVFEGLRPIISR
jgi:glycerophosphoryl diester phosphodiesterase